MDLQSKYGDIYFRTVLTSGGSASMQLREYFNYCDAQHDEDPLYIFDALSAQTHVVASITSMSLVNGAPNLQHLVLCFLLCLPSSTSNCSSTCCTCSAFAAKAPSMLEDYHVPDLFAEDLQCCSGKRRILCNLIGNRDSQCS